MPAAITVSTQRGITGNMLKLIAAVSMLIDHMGVIFFPYDAIFRVIGRLAFPIFAFMIAEGCFYTKNRLRYFLGIFLLGTACQLVYFFVSGDTYLNILLTFSCAIPIIYAGVFSGGMGYTLQILAQRDAEPAVASLLMSLESVFAVLAGWVILGDALSLRELLGCALMMGGIVLAQLPDKNAA